MSAPRLSPAAETGRPPGAPFESGDRPGRPAGRPLAARALALDLLCFGAVLLAAVLIRLLFAPRTPFLLMGDSETYLGPAVDLERGAGFDLALKRTPGYPLLVALTLGLFGEDPRLVALAQHALGVATALLTYLLGRALAGPLAGLLAGLAAALAGHLLLYERLIMSETLFTSLLVAALLALVRAGQGGGWRWALAAGLALGGATLVRPVAQALLVLAPLVLLLGGRGWRGALRGTLLVGLGYGLLLGPWVLWRAASSDDAAVGALGQTLIGRTARHDRRDPETDRGFVFYDPALHDGEADQTRLATRRILQAAANRGSSGRAVHPRLRRELSLGEAEADRLMRDLAIEAILRRPGYYLAGTLQRFGRLWVTPPERLSAIWDDQPAIVREWEDEDTAPLLDQPAAAVERDQPAAEALVGLFQPAQLSLAWPALFALGLAAALLDRRYRLALGPAAAVLLLMLLSVALVGGVVRYRYPLDPLILVLAAVGLHWTWTRARAALQPRPAAR